MRAKAFESPTTNESNVYFGSNSPRSSDEICWGACFSRSSGGGGRHLLAGHLFGQRAVDDDQNGEVLADHLSEGRAEALGVAILEPCAREVVLHAHDEDSLVGQPHGLGVFEPRLETRLIEFVANDIEDV